MVYTSSLISYRLISGKIFSKIPVISSAFLDSTTDDVKLLNAINKTTETVTIIARKTTGYALFAKIFLSIFLLSNKTKWFYPHISIYKRSKCIHNKYGKTHALRHIAEISHKDSKYSQSYRKNYLSVSRYR